MILEVQDQACTTSQGHCQDNCREETRRKSKVNNYKKDGLLHGGSRCYETHIYFIGKSAIEQNDLRFPFELQAEHRIIFQDRMFMNNAFARMSVSTYQVLHESLVS